MVKFIHIIIISSLWVSAICQDLHFSQFYSAPLTVNPANTGFFNADYRIGVNFKSQWPWGINTNSFTYRSFSAFADFAFLKDALPGNDWMGAGLVVLNDMGGDGELKVTKIIASIAYHKSMGYKNRYYLSFGIGGGYIQKNINYTKLYFDDQWNINNLTFDPKMPTHQS